MTMPSLTNCGIIRTGCRQTGMDRPPPPARAAEEFHRGHICISGETMKKNFENPKISFNFNTWKTHSYKRTCQPCATRPVFHATYFLTNIFYFTENQMLNSILPKRRTLLNKTKQAPHQHTHSEATTDAATRR